MLSVHRKEVRPTHRALAPDPAVCRRPEAHGAGEAAQDGAPARAWACQCVGGLLLVEGLVGLGALPVGERVGQALADDKCVRSCVPNVGSRLISVARDCQSQQLLLRRPVVDARPPRMASTCRKRPLQQCALRDFNKSRSWGVLPIRSRWKLSASSKRSRGRRPGFVDRVRLYNDIGIRKKSPRQAVLNLVPHKAAVD